MTKNVGMIDRAIRVIVGAAMLVAYFMMPELAYRWLLLIGVVPLVTGLVGSCALYSALGISTGPSKSG